MSIETTCIGAWPKPDYVKLPDWFNVPAGPDTADPTKLWQQALDDMGAEADAIISRGIREAVEDQVGAGIDIPTDGEVRRENYIFYQLRRIEGVDFDTVTHKSVRSGAFEADLPTITKPVSLRNPRLGDDYKAAQQFTDHPVKITIPGPMTITDSIADTYYNDEVKMGADLGNALNQEILALADAGCQYIQVDEPVFARKPQKALQ